MSAGPRATAESMAATVRRRRSREPPLVRKCPPVPSEHSRARPVAVPGVSLLPPLPCCALLVQADMDVVRPVTRVREPREVLLVTGRFFAPVLSVRNFRRYAEYRGSLLGFRVRRDVCYQPRTNIYPDTIVDVPPRSEE